MKRLLSAFLAIILLLGCFAGCKKGAVSTETTGAPTGTLPNGDNAPAATTDGLSLEENGVVYESLAQKAVVKTAIAYWYRGDRAQYDDTRLVAKGTPTANGTLYRWQSGVRKSPEEYTSQHTWVLIWVPATPAAWQRLMTHGVCFSIFPRERKLPRKELRSSRIFMTL